MTLTLTRVHHWTESDKEILRGMYDSTRHTIDLIAERIGASRAAVKSKASELGLTRAVDRHEWTPEMVAQLEKLTPNNSPKKIGRIMDMPENAIRNKQRRLRISSLDGKEWYTQTDIMELCGVTSRIVKRWIESGKLRATRYRSENGFWQVTPGDLKYFFMTCPGELQGHKVDMVTLVDLLCNVKAVKR